MNYPSIYKSQAGERAVMAWYDSVLARWPIPCDQKTIPTRHGHTFVIACGDASSEPLVLLHGAGTNSAMWRDDAVMYSRTHRVYMVDLLGEAGKSAPTRPPWFGSAYTEWLEDVLHELKLERARLIGFSQGGWTAIKFATAHPERVERLVLLTPGGIVPDRLSFVVRAIPLSLLGSWGIRRINRLLMGKQDVPEELEAAMTQIMTHFKTRIGTLPIFSDADLQKLTMPVLLLGGAQDRLRDTERIMARMRAQLPHLTARVIPNGGHALLNTPVQILPFLAAAD